MFFAVVGGQTVMDLFFFVRFSFEKGMENSLSGLPVVEPRFH